MNKNDQILKRLWEKVSPEPMSGCWLWTACTVDGYGQISIGGKAKYAHRVHYELVKGPIPKGLFIDHKCRVRCCVNVAHLEPVSVRENNLRGIGFAATNANKTHCLHGHEFTAGNTYRPPRKPNGRECYTCKKVLEKKRRKS